jgi:valyl-tRNA synthetase
MSKSKGNVMNPLELIDEYGADALRFAITTGVTPGNNQRIDERKIESARNFANKIWNASRFSISKIPDNNQYDDKLGNYDLWILGKLKIATEKVNQNLDQFNFGEAQKELYEFFWNEFCDWYIELYKSDEENNSIKNLIFVLQNSLKLLHPFLPFMTEKIWQILIETVPSELNKFKNEKTIINSSYPSDMNLKTADNGIESLITLIKSIRNLRSELRIEHSHILKINISDKEIFTNLSMHKNALLNLCNAELTNIKINNNFPMVVENNIFNIQIPKELNFSEEINRIELEINEIKKRIIPLSKRINSPNFYNNAPEDVINKENERLNQQNKRISQLEEILKSIN